MKKIKFVLFLILLMILSFGCSSYNSFLKETRDKYGLTESDLKYVQYYISSPVTLEYKQESSKSKVTSDNKVEIKKETYEKNIVIDEETPGIATELDEDEIFVSFANDLIIGFKVESNFDKAPYILNKFNGQVVKDNDLVNFRGGQFRIRFGSYSGKIGSGYEKTDYSFKRSNIPMLLYEFSSSFNKEKEVEVIEGMEL